jgi:hypothetical protein
VLNAAQPVYGGRAVCCGVGDAFVAKLTPDASAFVYSTFLGGSDGDAAVAIAVDPTGSAAVIGNTRSVDFPTTNGPQPTRVGGPGEAFVTQLTPTGSGFRFSTYLGGNWWVEGRDIAADAVGDVYITGLVMAETFPTANPLQGSLRGSRDAFISKITHAPLPAVTALDPAVATQGTALPVTVSGLNFVSGATAVTATGAGVIASDPNASSSTSLTTNLTIAADAPLGFVNITATTPQGTSNRREFTIYSSQPGCRVTLPVAVDGTPLDPFVHFGIGTLEPTDGTWAMLLVIYESGSVTMHGHRLFQGTIAPDQGLILERGRLFAGPPVLAMVNALFNPALCAFNVALTPTVDPAAEAGLRALLTSLVGRLTLPQ